MKILKTLYIFFIFNLAFSSYYPSYGPGKHWEVHTSTEFRQLVFDNITFDSIEVDYGIVGGTTGQCPDENCDILAVVYNNVPVGWSYMPINYEFNSNGEIFITIELNEGVTDNCELYPILTPFTAPVISYHFYDYSENRTYYNVGSSLVPSAQEPEYKGTLNIAGDGNFTSEDGFSFGNTVFPLGESVCPIYGYSNFSALGGSGDADLCVNIGCIDESACNTGESINIYESFFISANNETLGDTLWSRVYTGSRICEEIECVNDENSCRYLDQDYFGQCGCILDEELDGICEESDFWYNLDKCGQINGPNTTCFFLSNWGTESCPDMDCSGTCFGDDIVEYFDCNGNCLVEDDCAGECGGTAVFDDCGICNGGNVDMDCAGVCFGDAMFDNCGTCDNDTSNDCIEDCNGEFGGDALEDMCGVCDNDASNNCVQDCNGDWGGDALLDICGTCDNNPTNDCIQDCNGDWGGDAIIDDCGFCALGLTGLGANIADSEGFVTGPNADCLGVCIGNLDFIGNTGNLDENGYDCNNDCAGLAAIDDCGICAGGNTGNIVCSCPDWQRDCLGNCPGSIYLANDIIYQYNSDNKLSDLISEGVDGNVYISDSTLESMFGDQWNADSVEDLLGSTGFCYLNDELTGETCAIEGENDTCDEGSCFLLNIELGFDCNGNCAGNHLIDCSGECLLSGTNQLTSECSDTYMDEYGIVETDCDSISNESEGDLLYCCAQENIDCNNTCYGNWRTDVNEVCCDPAYYGCAGCGSENPPAENDDCGECGGEGCKDVNGITTPCGTMEGDYCDCEGSIVDCEGVCGGNATRDACDICSGSNIYLNDSSIPITGPDVDCQGACSTDEGFIGSTGELDAYGYDCSGACNGDAFIGTYYFDNDQDGLGSMESMNFCSTDAPNYWVDNLEDEDDNCYSNIHDCAGVCDGIAVIDCLGNCSNSEQYIGNSNNLDENGYDCSYNPDDYSTWEAACGGSFAIDDCGLCATDDYCLLGDNSEIDLCCDNNPDSETYLQNCACTCENWERDCSGNCPGLTYLGNFLEFQYNLSSENIGEYYTVTDEDSNYVLNESYFINMFGQSWLDSINVSDIILGYDCAGNCQGEEYIDCDGTCSNETEFLGNTGFLDENGYDCSYDPNDDSTWEAACGGGAYEDICEICYENGYDQDLVNFGFCYSNGDSTGEECIFDENGDSCSEGFCFIQGPDADDCGECGGSNQCVYYITATANNQYPDVEVSWNSIQSDTVITYYIYRNNQLIFETHSTFFDDNALAFDTHYCYKISAEIGDKYVEYINDYEHCITTTPNTPNYIFSLPEVINIPPNYPFDIPIKLDVFQAVLIEEMSVKIQYDPLVFIPDTVVGINSFSSENYNLQINNMGSGEINFYMSLSPNNNGQFQMENEDIFIISGFSRNGDDEFGEISIQISNTSPVFENLYYNGIIQISDFYVSISGSIDYYSNGLKTSYVDLFLEGYTSLNLYFADETISNNMGEFSFNGILPGTYNIIATKDNVLDIGGELSSTDASQIARNSIGLIQFNEYQLKAADVTLNGSVSGLDASKVARYRIGQIEALNEPDIHWAFYPEVLDAEGLMINAVNQGNSLISADCQYNPNVNENTCSEGPKKGMPCSEEMVNSPDCPLFLSIRLGDVTGNWNPTPLLSMSENRTDPIEVFIDEEHFSLPIKIVDNVEVEGVDIVIEFNNDFFQLENITFLEDELYSLGYNLMYNQNEGEIIISSFATMELAFVEEFVNIQFSIINNNFETSDIKINQFSINELNTESGFEIIDQTGNINITNHVIINSVDLSSSQLNIPKMYNLYQNYPNPFNPDTEIHFDLPVVTNVSIGIYDIMGNKIIELIDEKKYSAGKYHVKWDASDSPGGIYFCRMKAGNYIETHKMILLK